MNGRHVPLYTLGLWAAGILELPETSVSYNLHASLPSIQEFRKRDPRLAAEMVAALNIRPYAKRVLLEGDDVLFENVKGQTFDELLRIK